MVTRWKKFRAAFADHAKLIFIVPTLLECEDLKRELTLYPGLHFLCVDNFELFLSIFEKNTPKKPITSWKGLTRKVRDPSKAFPKRFNFKRDREKLQEKFWKVIEQETPETQFLTENIANIELVGRIPIGRLSQDCDVSTVDLKGKRTIISFLQNDTPCVLSVKFSEPDVFPEIIFCTKKKGKGRMQPMRIQKRARQKKNPNVPSRVCLNTSHPCAENPVTV